jgi:hypothetical protein
VTVTTGGTVRMRTCILERSKKRAGTCSTRIVGADQKEVAPTPVGLRRGAGGEVSAVKGAVKKKGNTIEMEIGAGQG